MIRLKLDKSIGERIMILRSERGYTRKTLAELAGISSKFLYEIETNKKGFSAYTLHGIAKALEVSMDYMMTGKGARVYDDVIFDIVYKFKPDDLESVEKLLEAVYKITAGQTGSRVVNP